MTDEISSHGYDVQGFESVFGLLHSYYNTSSGVFQVVSGTNARTLTKTTSSITYSSRGGNYVFRANKTIHLIVAYIL